MSAITGSLAPVDEDQYSQGWDAAWEAYEPGEPVGDPVGVSEDYDFGWWCGVGEAQAWHEGWGAAECGVLACPYQRGSDDDCFVDPWLKGYAAALSIIELRGRA